MFLEWNQPRAGMVVLKSDNRDFQTRPVIGDREGHHVVTKGVEPSGPNNCKSICTQHQSL